MDNGIRSEIEDGAAAKLDRLVVLRKRDVRIDGHHRLPGDDQTNELGIPGSGGLPTGARDTELDFTRSAAIRPPSRLTSAADD